MIPNNAQEYYTYIKSSLNYPVVTGLQDEIDKVIETFPDGEIGIRQFIQWLVACPLPAGLGIVDGTDFDTLVANHIENLQRTLKHHGFTPEVLPENAPKAASAVQIAPRVFTTEGGTNRARAAIDTERQKKHSAAKKLDSTEACKSALTEAHPECGPAKNWKRVSKHQSDGDTARVFQSGTTIKTVIYENYGDEPLTIKDGNLFPDQRVLMAALKKAAAQIKHNGDYGHLYFSPSEKKAYWCGADGDCEEEVGHSSMDDIERILKIPGIESVEVEAEHNPDLSEGFLSLGRCGITIEED